MKVAINGFGRIGRIFLRALLKRNLKGTELVAINDVNGAKNAAYLFKHDSIYGLYDGEVSSKDNYLIIDKRKIVVTSEREPEKLPWKKLGIDVVIECTGAFTDTAGAKRHLTAGAKKVLISAPCKDTDSKTIVLGVNEQTLKKTDTIISLGSCTTNCLAPVIKILEQHFGIERAFYNTIHAYTNDQSLHDSYHKKTRRGRAAARNIVPTNSGANTSVEQAIPEIKGKLNGLAIRVPIITGSVTDITAELKKEFTIEEVNKHFKTYAEGKMKGILEYSTDELVSSDIQGNEHSSIVDGLTTMKDGNLIKILAWYDNEYGYSNRLVDFLAYLK